MSAAAPSLAASAIKRRGSGNWANTTPDAISFPREMCIFFGYTIGQNFVCVNGTWLTAAQATAAGMGTNTIAQNL